MDLVTIGMNLGALAFIMKQAETAKSQLVNGNEKTGIKIKAVQINMIDNTCSCPAVHVQMKKKFDINH